MDLTEGLPDVHIVQEDQNCRSVLETTVNNTSLVCIYHIGW